ncbi:MAG: hypothetical protein HYU36_24735 [Planctomycetes bacterium]|nr:hypothetical protein [Planctomycetota bacterium]
MLTATGSGNLIQIDARGDGFFEFAGFPGQVLPVRYNPDGFFITEAQLDGMTVGTMTVQTFSVGPVIL